MVIRHFLEQDVHADVIDSVHVEKRHGSSPAPDAGQRLQARIVMDCVIPNKYAGRDCNSVRRSNVMPFIAL